jgi:hypothetical protein
LEGGLYRVILTPGGATVADTPFIFQSDGGLDVEQGPDGTAKPSRSSLDDRCVLAVLHSRFLSVSSIDIYYFGLLGYCL